MERRKEFLELWTEAYLKDLPVSWVRKKYGSVSDSSVTSFASSLRSQGEHLPKLKRGRKDKSIREKLSQLMK